MSSADEQGNIVPDLVKKDARMAAVLDQGFKWLVFPWQVEETWPLLPDLCQRALNSSHSVTNKSNELAVMAAIVDMESRRSGGSYNDVLETLKLSGPVCLPYLDMVGSFACVNAGGPGAPLIHFLDRFAKKFGEHKLLGEEMFAALVALKSPETDPWIFLRVGILAANLTSLRVVDGIARLITKTDVDRLRSMKDKASQANAMIKQAWELCHGLMDAGSVSPDACDILVGKFMVRMVLNLTGKEMQGPEKKVYQGSDAIIEALATAIRAEAGDSQVDLGEWSKFGETKQKPNVAPAADTQASEVVSLHDLSNHARIFAKKGFSIGCMIKERHVDHSEIYQITSQDAADGSVSMFKWSLTEEPTEILKVPLQQLVSKWAPYSAPLPAFLEVEPEPFKECKGFKHDQIRWQVLGAITGLEKSVPVRYLRNPSGVVVTGKVGKGAMQCSPMTLMVNSVLSRN